MAKKESTDAAGGEATTGETLKGSSIDPWPEIDRDTKRTATDDEPTTANQTSDENETATDCQSDEITRDGDDQSHGCNHENAVPCRFQ